MASRQQSPTALRALLQQAIPFSQPERLARLILRADPQFRRLSPAEADQVIGLALDVGAHYAREAQSLHGTRDPVRLATHLGIRVITADEPGRWGNILQYAEYRSRPPVIHVYRQAMERLNRFLADPDVGNVFGLSDATPAFLAHEIFHHLDNLPNRPSVKRARQVVTFQLGPWQIHSGLISVPEIAANSFAQTLLGLPYHLKLLDLVAIFSESSGQADWWVHDLIE